MSESAATKSYWKSLERLYDSPPVRDALDEEFGHGASLPPRGLARRRMLQLLGASFALAGVASCRRPEEAIVPFVEAPEDYVPGAAKHYASTMTLGTNACGIIVESHEGRPTKIEGNELHPASRGAASAWMQAALLELYDPDRSSSVLRRSEDTGELEPSSWEAFLDAWRPAARSFESSGGKGLALLTKSYASPSLARVRREFENRFSSASWVVYEPAGDENAFAGSMLATGRALRPIYHLDRAKRILTLDSDLLLTETGALTHAAGFAESRRPENGDTNRLYAVESTLTTTGANADHRLPLPSHQIPLFLLHLAAELGLGTTASLPPLDGEVARAARVIAEDLAGRPGEALVTVGRCQPPEAHAAAFVLNGALGAFGSTLTLVEPLDTDWGRTAALVALVDAMNEGEVDTLIVLGGNPVYDAPEDLEFTAALENVDTTVHLSSHVDETSRLAAWHLPRAHFLESWGDARALDGTPSIVQPLVAPLFGGRSTIEVLALLSTDDHRDGFGLVRDAWLPGILGDDDVETRWNRTLHDGVYASGPDAIAAFEPDAERATGLWEGLARRVSESGSGIELVFTLSPAVHDGRFANNGWLQELPDPITKLTWDNAALVSPRTAERLGLASEDIVSIENGALRIAAPVLVSPGQSDESIGLALGYGRWAAGRVGNGVGVNAHAVRSAQAPFLQTGVRVRKLAGRRRLALTQEHWSMEGRQPIRESVADPHVTIVEPVSQTHHAKAASLWEEPVLGGELQWGMVIDLNACQGCNACIVACQSENNIPIVGQEQVLEGREMQWLRVDRYFSGPPEDPKVSFQPVPCMHCENAPCEQVCPVGATVHDSEGINAMVYNRCIGTRYCSNNCPYKVRRFNFFNYTKDIPEITSMAMNPDVTVRSRGVMEKCTYCIQRINETKRSGRPMMTACQQTCPAEAITFGNVADPESPVSTLKGSPRNYVLLEELFTKPRTSYLTKLRNTNPEWFRA